MAIFKIVVGGIIRSIIKANFERMTFEHGLQLGDLEAIGLT